MPNKKSAGNERSSARELPRKKTHSKNTDVSSSFFQSPTKVIVSCVVGVAAIILAWDVSNYLSKIDRQLMNQSTSTTTETVTVDSGGWRPADEDTEKLYSTDICHVERRSSLDLSAAEFESEYRYKKPVIVTFPNGASDWTEPEQWTVSSLKREYGEWIVLSSNSRDIVRQGGSGHHETSLADFIDRLIRDVDQIDEPYYVFDRDFYNDSSLPLTLQPPAYFEIKDGVDDSIFFLGSSRSGVTFHKHADSWNGVLFGQKHWFLYPIEMTPPGGVHPGYTQLEWFANIYPTLTSSQRPLQCVQKAGEIFYLPEGIYHATINLGDTVAIGIQKKEAITPVEKLFYEENSLNKRIKAGDPQGNKLRKRRKKIFDTLLKLIPDNAEVHLKAGLMYYERGENDKAVYLLQRAIALDEHFIVAVLNLAFVQSELEHYGEAEQLYKRAMRMNPRLWDVYAKYGDFLVNQNRPAEAVPIYKKGTELEPDSFSFWAHLQVAQLRSGDQEGADESGVQIQRIKTKH